MAVRTIRHLAIYGAFAEDLVHKVRSTSSRGFNGTDYVTYCGAKLMSGVKWADPQYERVTCLRCLGTPKCCSFCGEPVTHPLFPSDVVEQCDRCKV